MVLKERSQAADGRSCLPSQADAEHLYVSPRPSRAPADISFATSGSKTTLGPLILTTSS